MLFFKMLLYKDRWRFSRKPDSVLRLEEFESLQVHLQGFDLQRHRLAIASADSESGLYIF